MTFVPKNDETSQTMPRVWTAQGTDKYYGCLESYILYLDMYQQYFRETLKFSLCIVMIEAKIALKVSSMGLSTDPFSRRHPLIQRIQSGYQPVTSLDTNHPA